MIHGLPDRVGRGVVLVVALLTACAEDRTGTLPVSTSGVTVVPTTASHAVPVPPGSLAGDAETFRIHPSPGPDGTVTLTTSDTLVVNASDFGRLNPGLDLHLVVNWGGGAQERVSCGPCRLQHAYGAPGRFRVEATIDDGRPVEEHSTASVTWTADVVVTSIASCDEDGPPPPGAGVDTGTKTIFWTPVPGAKSYNVYVKAVEGCTELGYDERVSHEDPKWTVDASPFDVSSFNRCQTCYYYGVTAVRGGCESPLYTAGGFMLGPCVP